MRLFFLIVLFLSFIACQKSNDNVEDIFHNLVMEVLPKVMTSTSRMRTTNVCNSNPQGVLQTVCETFEAYTEDNWNNEEATLGHEVSMTNFYKFMIQTDSYISDGLKKSCESVNGKVKIDYDDGNPFWMSTDDYVCKAKNQEESSNRFQAYAWDQSNNKYAVLYDHQDDRDEALTFGYKAETSFDLTVLAAWTTPGQYRRFTGLTTDKTFTMEDYSGSTPDKIILAGYAQGEGKHFLAKINDSTGTYYYCFTITTEENITTKSGKTYTVISQLDVSDKLTTCNSSSCGGCKSDAITVGGTSKSLPDAVDYLFLHDENVKQAQSHFKHEFETAR